MKVVCIKNFLSQGLQYELTYGKVYQLEPTPSWYGEDNYFIKCDRGFIGTYHKNSFVTLEQWREMELNKIL